MKRTRQTGELALIRQLTRGLRSRAEVSTGIGDDCAVVRRPGAREELLFTTDAVIEGVHFLAGEQPARVGHKAVGRALSDIAAMGGEPLYLLIDLVAAPDTPVATLQGLYRGAERLARRHGAAIIGGDTARGPRLELHVFGVGRAPRGAAILRSGARPGDALFVTGPLGGSRAGRHLDFEPRVDEGCWLARRGVTAMIDITDGLATDLGHLVRASGLTAVVDAADVPVAPAARAPAHAWTDGEDFELLFAVAAGRAPSLARAWQRRFGRPLHRIGACVAGRPRIRVRHPDGTIHPLRLRGYEHFRT